MMNVYYRCGLYRADKVIDLSGPYSVCPECGHPHPFVMAPLFVVSGASGAGKSTVCQLLTGQFQEDVTLDSDILWQEAFNTPDTQYRNYFETWLRLCKNIPQSGRSVVLFGAGVGVPENLEDCIEKRYFKKIHYLALVYSDEVLAQRLRSRLAWRGTRAPDFIQEHTRFNQWFLSYPAAGNQPPITLLNRTNTPPEETAREVMAWVKNYLT